MKLTTDIRIKYWFLPRISFCRPFNYVLIKKLFIFVGKCNSVKKEIFVQNYLEKGNLVSSLSSDTVVEYYYVD